MKIMLSVLLGAAAVGLRRDEDLPGHRPDPRDQRRLHRRPERLGQVGDRQGRVRQGHRRTKVGAKVTVEYTMTANTVEVKAEKPAKAPKAKKP